VSQSALVIIPTYNERANIPVLVGGLMKHAGVRVLIVDDNSPDGTGALAEELGELHGGRVSVLHRTTNRGFGRSYIAGMTQALAEPVDLICQMDADLSHDPKYLPEMIAKAAAGADLVIGSRYLNGISVVNWPLRRIILSSFANFYIRTVTGLHMRDITTGYRCWRRASLAKLPLDRIVSDGYAFLLDVTFMAADAGLQIVESPIIFVERRIGASKLSGGVLLESLFTPWKLIARHGRIKSRPAQEAK
jgi:dolichol-phosphate mannosyltransferase